MVGARSGDNLCRVVVILHALVLFRQEDQERLAYADMMTVGAEHPLRGRVSALGPVGTVDPGEGAVEARVLVLVVEHRKRLLGRGHTRPGTSEELVVGTQDRGYLSAVVSLRSHVGIVPLEHPAGEVVSTAAAAVGQARAVVLLGVLGVVGIQYLLAVAVVGAEIYLVEVVLETERAGILDSLHGKVVGLLEVPCIVVSVGVDPVAERIGRYVLGILQPPCVGQVSLREHYARRSLGEGSGKTGIVRQVLHRRPQVGEYAPRVDLGHGVAHGGTHGSRIELEFAGTEIERHAAEYPHEVEILEGPEEPRLGDERGIEAYALGILDDTVGRIDIGEGPVASGIARIVEHPVAGHVRNLEVAVGTLREGGLVGAGRQEVIGIGIAVLVSQAGIERSQTALDTRRSREEVGSVAGLGMFLEHPVT